MKNKFFLWNQSNRMVFLDGAHLKYPRVLPHPSLAADHRIICYGPIHRVSAPRASLVTERCSARLGSYSATVYHLFPFRLFLTAAQFPVPQLLLPVHMTRLGRKIRLCLSHNRPFFLLETGKLRLSVAHFCLPARPRCGPHSTVHFMNGDIWSSGKNTIRCDSWKFSIGLQNYAELDGAKEYE